MKYKIYQRKIDRSINPEREYEYTTLTEKQFNIIHIMKIMGWRLLYEV